MLLSELAPEWINYQGRKGVGVCFRCPHCSTTLAVLFLNPLDGSTPLDEKTECLGNNGGKRWARSGMSLEDVTVSPSIDAPGHWHGLVLDGKVV